MNDALYRRLRTQGLARVADQLQARAMETLALQATRTDEVTMLLGASKMGGHPDLPGDVAWPELQGRPMAFVAQVRLADIAMHDAACILPPTGLLSFFAYDAENDESDEPLDRSDDTPEGRVLLIAGDASQLVRRQAPPALSEFGVFHPCSLSFEVEGTLPDPSLFSVASLLTAEEWQSYANLYFDRGTRPVSDHRLLGYPCSRDGNVLMECYLSSHGDDQSHSFRRFDRRELANLVLGHGPAEMRAELETAAAGWRLLLQVETNGEAEMDWLGGGVLYFCLSEGALRAGRFDEVCVTVQTL